MPETDPPALGIPLELGREPATVTFDLPYCLYLRDHVFTVRIADSQVDLQLVKQWREREEEFSNVEIQDDPAGQYRYTAVRAAFTLGDGDDPQEIALAAVNRLVDVYRYVTGRAYLRPLSVHDLAQVRIDYPGRREGTVSFSFGSGGLGAARPDDDAATHDVVIEMLASGEPVPLHSEILLTAARLHREGYYRQVVIDAVVAIQVFLEQLLRQRLERPSDEVDALLSQEALGDLMKVPLEEAIGWRVSADRELWSAWLYLNDVRRGAVHRGARVDVDTAAEALEIPHRIVAAIEERAVQPEGDGHSAR